jgi:cell division initiation protein
MNVTPLDLRNQQFRSALRGFDKDEVLAFLAEAADDYAAALREADRLRQDVARLEGVVHEHRESEKNLRNTLLTVQRLADEIRDNAHQQAAQIVKDAESRASLVLEKAQARFEDVQREIDGLRLKRREVETSVESVISTLRNTIEFVREQDARDRDEKVLLHRPRTIDIREASVWNHERREDEAAELA